MALNFFFSSGKKSGKKEVPSLEKGEISEEDRFLELLGSGKEKDFIEIKRYLKTYPDLFNRRNASGETIFHLAVLFGKKELIEKLCDFSAFEDLAYLRNEREETIFHYVVRRKKEAESLLSLLINKFPHIINYQDRLGETALHRAVRDEREWAVDRLVQEGKADITIKNRAGQSPIALCLGDKKRIASLMRLDVSFFEKNDENKDMQNKIEKTFPAIFIKKDFFIAEEKQEESLKRKALTEKDDLFDVVFHKDEYMIGKGRAIRSVDFSGNNDLKILWEISLFFDKTKITFQILALAQEKPADEIISNLNKLFDYFNPHQLLVANFIIKTIVLFFDVQKIPYFYNQMECFFEKSRMAEKIEGMFYEDIILKMFFIKKDFPPIVEAESIICVDKKESFDDVVEMALKVGSGSPKQKELIEKMAREIRMKSLYFYKNIELRDFVNLQSEGMLRHIEHFEKLVNYFGMKILTQPRKNLLNTATLIMKIIKELCLITHKGPDLMGIRNMMGIFHIMPIARLYLVNDLEKEYKDFFSDLERMISSEHGRWLREISLGYEKSIPFSGLLRSEIVRSKENDELDRLEMVGKTLSIVLLVKKVYEEEAVFFRTDIEDFLETFCPWSEDEMYYASYRILLRNSDQIDLSAHSFDTVLSILQNDYLEHQFLPRIKKDDKIYELHDVVGGLIDWYSEQKEFITEADHVMFKKIIFNVEQVLREKYETSDSVDLMISQHNMGVNKGNLLYLSERRSRSNTDSLPEKKKEVSGVKSTLSSYASKP